MDDKVKKVLKALEAQCAKREYCTSDIRHKAMTRLEGDSDAAQEVVDSLVKDGFVDDLRYASAFAREKSSITGWGPVKIRYALSAKGVARQAIDSALEETDASKADARLQKLLEAKKKTLEGDPQARLKLIRFALSRGYEYEDIRELL